MTATEWTRKYRPQTIDKYVGNKQLTKNITHLIANNNLPNMIMLEGERGTGKTSMARLIAKSLLCEEPINNQPCENCHSCNSFNTKFFTEGVLPRDIPVYEEDMSKTNKREDATILVDKMSARVVGGGRRVYILDEMQRTTKEAQSCFLKIAEEPPKDLFIIICTTNPEQLLTPLLSRFHRFVVKKPTVEELTDHLVSICVAEGVNYQKTALRTIVREQKNNTRETLTKTSMFAKLGDITKESVNEEYSMFDDNVYLDFLSASRKGSLFPLIKIQNEFEEDGTFSVNSFIIGFGEYLMEIMKLRYGVNTERYTPTELKKHREEIKNFSEDEIFKLLQIVNKYTKSDKMEMYQLMCFGADIQQMMVEEIVELKDNADITPTKQTAVYAEVTEKVIEAQPVAKPKKVDEQAIMSIFGNNLKKVKLNGNN